MTATTSTITTGRNSAKVTAALFGVLMAVLVVAMLASLYALAPAARAARLTPVAPAPDAAAPIDLVRPAGGTVEFDGWSVHVGELQWGQTSAVAATTPLNPLVAEGFEWVLLPVEVTSHRSETADVTGLEVTLLAGQIRMSHRYKAAHHYPMSVLPDELDLRGIPSGSARTGNLGWAVPSTSRDAGTCLLEVRRGAESAYFSCAGTPRT